MVFTGENSPRPVDLNSTTSPLPCTSAVKRTLLMLVQRFQ